MAAVSPASMVACTAANDSGFMVASAASSGVLPVAGLGVVACSIVSVFTSRSWPSLALCRLPG